MCKWSCELKCRNAAVLPHGYWIYHWEWPCPHLISISTSCFIKICHNECVLLGSLVPLQSSYLWSNSNQKKSHEGLRFSGELRRWLMLLPAFPPQLILYPVNKQALSGAPLSLFKSELRVVCLNMEFSGTCNIKRKICWLMINVALAFPHRSVSYFISPDNSSFNLCWFICRGERCNVLLWLPFHFAWSKWVNY